jgi:hypothetical protein
MEVKSLEEMRLLLVDGRVDHVEFSATYRRPKCLHRSAHGRWRNLRSAIRWTGLRDLVCDWSSSPVEVPCRDRCGAQTRTEVAVRQTIIEKRWLGLVIRAILMSDSALNLMAQWREPVLPVSPKGTAAFDYTSGFRFEDCLQSDAAWGVSPSLRMKMKQQLDHSLTGRNIHEETLTYW